MTKRNENGIASSCDQYRTIKGVRWSQWVSCLTKEALQQYKDGGVRCRYIQNELYIHPEDMLKAAKIDETQRSS